MSDSDDILPKGVNKIMKDIVAKRYACPICKKVYKDDTAAHQCRNRCASIICEESSVKEPRYVTPCGCVFLSPWIAEKHNQIQKDCCGYFKNETRKGINYYYIIHASGDSEYCYGFGILANHEGINFSKYIAVSDADSPFTRSRCDSKTYYRLVKTAKKITSEEFDQGTKDCIDSIKESINKSFHQKRTVVSDVTILAV